MATSDLVNYLDGKAADVGTSNRRIVETFLCGSTAVGTPIAAGDWVAFEAAATDGLEPITVIKAGTASLGNSLVCGVALEAGTAVGARIQVVTRGYVADANVASTTAAGPLVVDGAAGRAEAAVAADHTAPPCGASLATASGNKADVIVYSNFR
tara:strand:- start:7134 stop:7595 length:462 start_codon:yes stop_codon:yes gene_type:complete